ncbi:MAG: tetratricopeptide repeat protein [Verrucomicrobia bacterium]|nr:tetratricopeptide repeat protein [Verrucomicrobiota bacterium]
MLGLPKWISGRRDQLGLGFILLATLIVYVPNLGHPFQYDDRLKIVHNDNIADPLLYFRVFQTAGYSEWTTRLTANLSYSLNYFLFGFDSYGFNATNLLIHLLNVWLVFRFGRFLIEQTGKRGSRVPLIAAGLFALHPLNTEAVNYCNARANTLCTAFYLATLLSLPLAIEALGKGIWEQIKRWAIFAVLLAGTLTSKELGVTVVIAAPVLLFVMGEHSERYRALRPMIWRFGIGVVLVGLMATAFTGAWSMVIRIVYTTAPDLNPAVFLVLNALKQAQVFVQYLLLSIFPLPGYLNADHDVRPLIETLFVGSTGFVEGGSRQLIVPVICAVGLVGILGSAFLVRRRKPMVSYLLLWPIFTHAPTSLVPRGEQMVEYRTYLPMVAVCLLLATGFCALWEWLAGMSPKRGVNLSVQKTARRRTGWVGWAFTVVVLGAFILGTHVRNQVWKTELGFWLDVVGKSPNKWRSWNNLGYARETAGDFAGAISDYGHALKIRPGSPATYYNRANARVSLGDFEGAITDFDQAIRYDADYMDAYVNRGRARLEKGDVALAIADFTEVLRRNSRHAWAYVNRAAAWARIGDMTRALMDCNGVLLMYPEFSEAYLNRGNVRASLGDWTRAGADFSEAIRCRPDNLDAYLNRAISRATLNDAAGAQEDLSQCLRISTKNWSRRNYALELAQRLRTAKDNVR